MFLHQHVPLPIVFKGFPVDFYFLVFVDDALQLPIEVRQSFLNVVVGLFRWLSPPTHHGLESFVLGFEFIDDFLLEDVPTFIVSHFEVFEHVLL